MDARPTFALQLHLLGGVDVLELAGRRVRPVSHVPSVRAAAALVRARGARLLALPGFDESARCPRCGWQGPVLLDFGLRPLRGRMRPQSWCRRCRGTHQELADEPPCWANMDASAPAS